MINIRWNGVKESIDDVLQSSRRKLVVSENDIDLVTNIRNEIFILMVEESPGSAGGRGGGSGSRRIDSVLCFSYKNGTCTKYFEVTEPEKVEQFDIPYSAIAMDIKLSTGKPIVVQGIVDPDLVKSYQALVNILKWTYSNNQKLSSQHFEESNYSILLLFLHHDPKRKICVEGRIETKTYSSNWNMYKQKYRERFRQISWYKEPSVYKCVCCGNDLFNSDTNLILVQDGLVFGH